MEALEELNNVNLSNTKIKVKGKCENCVYTHKVFQPKTLSVSLECRFNPPTVLVEPLGGGQVRTLSFFPPVGKDQWCGHFALEEK